MSVRLAAVALAATWIVPDLRADETGTTRAALDLLTQHCIACHSGSDVKGGLDLTSREGLLRGGDSGRVVAAGGRADESEFLRRIRHESEPGMPYRRPKLSAADVETLSLWIRQGAAYDRKLDPRDPQARWWSLRPLRRPAVPQIPDACRSWCRNPIDAFVLARQLQAGLAPSAEADRRTLLRRLKLDLLGLQPTPAEVEAFVADPRPDAFERKVDEYLDSPHYGERWARHWMDAAHFAETHGNDQDRPRPHAWPYRDYLIRSFNADKPFARFLQEQVAGDALFPGDPDGVVALGFLASGPWDESSLRDIREDTLDREIAQYLDRDDVVTTVMSTFASTTVHCARCHEHKFDPIPQSEYYALQAVFAGVDKSNRPYDPDPSIAAQRGRLIAEREELKRRTAARDPGLLTEENEKLTAAWERELADGAWHVIRSEDLLATGAELRRLDDGSVLSGGPRPEKDSYTVAARIKLPRITAVRLELLCDDSLPHKGPGRQDNGNLHLNEFIVKAGALAGDGAAGMDETAEFRAVRADFDQQGWTAAHAIDGNPATAWGIYPEVGKPHQAVFEFKQPIERPEGVRLLFRLEQTHGGGHLIGRFRLSVTGAARPLELVKDALPPDVGEIAAVPRAERTPEQRAALAGWVLLQEVERRIAELPPQQLVYVASNDFAADGTFRPASTPRPIHLLHRGDIRQKRDPAAPGALSCVADLDAAFPLAEGHDESARRAALALWLSDARNGLVWRSIVNRLWHHHFGRGIVDTPNDFGRMGAEPTHPELLDWLAVELQQQGGSLKAVHRLICTSSVWRQRSAEDPAKSAVDADNRLLWRMNRSRLDAESVHDALLVVTGTLDARMGGPSVKQFVESPGIHVTPIVDYEKFDPAAPENYRRAVYRFIFRTLPDPFMESLDCADASQWTPARNVSLSALQALALLHNKSVIQQARHLAEALERESPGDLEGQVRGLFRRTLLRAPSEDEARRVRDYAARHGLANACRLLFNTNEFLFVD